MTISLSASNFPTGFPSPSLAAGGRIVYIGTAKEMPADRKRPDKDAIVTRWIPDDAEGVG